VTNAGGPRFLHGQLFTHLVSFPQGTVSVKGIVDVDHGSRTLRLWDVDISPVPTGRLDVGASGVRQVFAAICALAVPDGFDTLIVNGYRISGANPNRDVELVFDCRLHPRRPGRRRPATGGDVDGTG